MNFVLRNTLNSRKLLILQKPLLFHSSAHLLLPRKSNKNEYEVEDLNEDEDIDISKNEDNQLSVQVIPKYVSALPLYNRPLFPGFYKSLEVKHPTIAETISKGYIDNVRHIALFLARNKDGEDSQNIKDRDDVYKVGVLAQIVSAPRLSDGILNAIILPTERIRMKELKNDEAVSKVSFSYLRDEPFDVNSPPIKAMMQEIFATIADITKLNPFFRLHIETFGQQDFISNNPPKLSDFVGTLSSVPAQELQEILESLVIEERLKKALQVLKKDLWTANIQHSISKDIENNFQKRQREYVLHEQLKTIKKELGLEVDAKQKIIDDYNAKMNALNASKDVLKVYHEEINRLSLLESSSAEFNVTRNYLDWLTGLPWGKTSAEALDYYMASKVLDEDHYGLKDVKDAILEFIAVGNLLGSVKGKILCLSGPPGVGKTSVGRSIAKALNREYFRFSVGGLSDVAELKGHRRTYVGAMPGKIIQALKRVQTENPLILIDEVDKISPRSANGDPSSALLELLDPEQNNSFLDHYLDIPVDLSKVLFVCTANDISQIPGPLLDRMEVIKLSGYILEEKVQIAKQYLVPATMKDCGLKDQVRIDDETLSFLIKSYTRENGVRGLKKEIEKIMRKVAKKMVTEDKEKIDIKYEVTVDNINQYSGYPVYKSDRLYEVTPIGVTMGLGVNSLGGSALFIEAILNSHGEKGQLKCTGQFGSVMEESAAIAFSYAKYFISKNYPDNKFFSTASIHLHIPDGSSPKDGPSAGITMTSALISLALNCPVKKNFAMTGELSLTGKVLAVGGIKQKTIAAKQSGATSLIIPKACESSWMELDDYIKKDIEINFVEDYEQVFSLLFDKTATEESKSNIQDIQ